MYNDYQQGYDGQVSDIIDPWNKFIYLGEDYTTSLGMEYLKKGEDVRVVESEASQFYASPLWKKV